MWVAFSHCEYFLLGRWNSTDLVNRSLYCRCLPPFYLKSHLFASYERPSCAHSTLVYLYGGSIEMSVNRRCLLFTIILKSVSSSVDPTTFLILVILYDLQFLSLSLFYSHSLSSPVTSESATRKMETSASAWTQRRGEWISPLSYICENAMLPRITAVACPIGVISSSKEIS